MDERERGPQAGECDEVIRQNPRARLAGKPHCQQWHEQQHQDDQERRQPHFADMEKDRDEEAEHEQDGKQGQAPG